jgi:hypothetical protein
MQRPENVSDIKYADLDESPYSRLTLRNIGQRYAIFSCPINCLCADAMQRFRCIYGLSRKIFGSKKGLRRTKPIAHARQRRSRSLGLDFLEADRHEGPQGVKERPFRSGRLVVPQTQETTMDDLANARYAGNVWIG